MDLIVIVHEEVVVKDVEDFVQKMLWQIRFHHTEVDVDAKTAVNLPKVKNWCLWNLSVDGLFLIEEWGGVQHL